LKNYPKISIITPVFNQVNYIEHTIVSILSQGYPNLEYIIIDGGSTDGTLDIIKKYESQLGFWLSEPDKGMYEAIQKGFDRSTGEIMAWLNSDDMYHPRSLGLIAEIFQDFPTVKWLTGIPTCYDEKGRVVQIGWSARWSKYRYYNLSETFIQQESTFWHRHLWEASGSKVNTSLRLAGDFDLWIRFFQHEKLYFVASLVGGFRMRSSNQLSLDHYQEYLQEAAASRKKIMDILPFSDKLKTKLLAFHWMISAIPFIGRIYKKLNFEEHFFGFPNEIIFNRSQQKFVFRA
jgi:glycosyltransferase involved in cell wall biosynthesis